MTSSPLMNRRDGPEAIRTQLTFASLLRPMRRTQPRRIIQRREARRLVSDKHEQGLAGPDVMPNRTLQVLAVEEVDLDLALVESGEASVDRAEFVDDRNVGRNCFAQCVERRHAIVRIKLSATAAHDLGGRGIGTDNRDGGSRRGGEREDAVVFQQHGAFRAGPANERTHFRTVVGALRRDHRIGEGAHTVDQSQHPQRRLTHRLSRDPALPIRCKQLCPTIARRSRHLQIEPAVHGLDS